MVGSEGDPRLSRSWEIGESEKLDGGSDEALPRGRRSRGKAHTEPVIR